VKTQTIKGIRMHLGKMPMLAISSNTDLRKGFTLIHKFMWRASLIGKCFDSNDIGQGLHLGIFMDQFCDTISGKN